MYFHDPSVSQFFFKILGAMLVDSVSFWVLCMSRLFVTYNRW